MRHFYHARVSVFVARPAKLWVFRPNYGSPTGQTLCPVTKRDDMPSNWGWACFSSSFMPFQQVYPGSHRPFSALRVFGCDAERSLKLCTRASRATSYTSSYVVRWPIASFGQKGIYSQFQNFQSSLASPTVLNEFLVFTVHHFSHCSYCRVMLNKFLRSTQ